MRSNLKKAQAQAGIPLNKKVNSSEIDKQVEADILREDKREAKRKKKLNARSWFKVIASLFVPSWEAKIRRGKKEEVKILETKDNLKI
eukprot:CAMPEP_0170487346 /NCGR_PEP_ID=MMETSP0208-20121228/6195_1 /TAXON_ID=197538 /ORGANISM="Strombidium inclinatum, Strain S3" /LENGTH=87 /DNA_ID=CAMNT_0010761607 /DNA_START=628 /DNA_END=890 /DNA_ORIENTATION=+